VQKNGKNFETMLRELPDAESVRLFVEQFSNENPRVFERLKKQEGLLSDVLAIAAWSPLLSTTILQHPDYINWLGRERTNIRVRTREELLESLARFSLTNSQLDTHVLLSRFRRRELLRIYLRDIRRTNTLVEITEELSNLADAILQHALNLSQQRLDNLYGKPQRTDERGRTTTASFCIIALGKLGSLELNYASDIDLLFLYSDEGNTSGQGERGETTNRQYFVKLAEAITKLVGQPTGEGAAYRVDLRLRPFGRDGVLASSLNEAVRYYREKAQAWELQAMIRARASAGNSELFTQFYSKIKNRVYARNVSVADALNHVKLSKQKIDRQHAVDREGFNVKLGRGGIREIEFIAQALQLAFGGRDEWLRAPHTLVSLGRLAERNLISEKERTELFAAYNFLRRLEHCLQMEHGLQTHSIPVNHEKRSIVARRMKLDLREFDRTLSLHTSNVRSSFERVFGKQENELTNKTGIQISQANVLPVFIEPVEVEQSTLFSAAKIFSRFVLTEETELHKLLNESLRTALNRKRAVTYISRISSSLEKSDIEFALTNQHIKSLVRLCGVSDYFGEMIAANPLLIASIREQKIERDYKTELRDAVTSVDGFRNEIGVLRREWAKMILEIGTLDAFDSIEMHQANLLQTELAEASLEVALLIAQNEMVRHFISRSPLRTPHPAFAVFGLGRLGGRGMDYGSDLDVVLVYDDDSESPFEQLSLKEAYSKYVELFITALSSMTREGSVYRVDLRLRPDGKNGATCTGANAFLNYLKERAAIWEWLAYVKLRFAAGDSSFGTKIEEEARAIIHESAKSVSTENLKNETRRVRERLEREKTKNKSRSFSLDIKYGAGGMLDVYFATRFLQLRDDVRDEGFDRSTKTTLEKLFKANSLDERAFRLMSEGYKTLRGLDHNLRLIAGRSSHLPSKDHPTLEDIAKHTNFKSAIKLTENITQKMDDIREAYDLIIR
jgi:glutamate-ammonia-ligase adenylyltransferase